MPRKRLCPWCGKAVDPRGAAGHARSHGIDSSEVNTEEWKMADTEPNKPVRHADSAEDVMQRIDNGEEVVDVADNAIVFRNEIIITDPEIKERVADALVESVGAGSTL